MVEPWIKADAVRASVRQNVIYLTQKDAETILTGFDQDMYYQRHAPKVVGRVWDGKPINGVDMRNHPNANAKKTSHQFLTNHQGMAYTISVDGQTNVFQPHVGGVQGWHALTSKKVACDCGAFHSSCPTCSKEHDVEEEMAKAVDQAVKSRAAAEMMVQVLYKAQEIYDRRMEALDWLADEYWKKKQAA